MRVAVFGMGYVGLVTAAGLAKWGHEVIGIEVDTERLDALRAGRLPLFEPGLDALVEAGVAGKRLRFTDRLDGIGAIQVAIVAVGTHDGNGGWQTDTIKACFAGMAPKLADDAVLVIRSTLPPEFLPRIRPMVDSLRAAAGRPSIPVVVNPEFTREGTAVMDYLEPDRIVIGVISDDTGAGVRQLRRMYHSVTAPFLVMQSEDAVLAKLGANLFLATKISFANELAMLCEAYNADVTQVVEAMSHDARIGGAFLRAGIGFGGSCLPHQVTMTVHAAEAAGRSHAPARCGRPDQPSAPVRLRRPPGGRRRRIARGRPRGAPGPDLQAGHGRPARGTVADHRRGGHRGRRRGGRVRPDGIRSQPVRHG